MRSFLILIPGIEGIFRIYRACLNENEIPQARQKESNFSNPGGGLLIAVILVEAVVGFAFGLLGSFTHTAEVSVAVTSCNDKAGVLTCTFIARNTSTGSANTTGVSITHGATYQDTDIVAVRVGTGQTVTIT